MDLQLAIWAGVYLIFTAALVKRYAQRAIEPLLGEARTTTERAGWMSLQAQASICPASVLIFLLIVSAALFAVGAATITQDSSLAVTAIAFGPLAAYLAVLLIVKLRSRK
jgi:hypothetical protein